ncbi:MAG: trigger factor [Eubacteriales bacterium]|nr:trigger factor [Eubacteriales bacterium]MDY4213430.1 trigger factor [Eubacteriales bacterium]
MSTVEKVDKNVVSFEFTVSADEFDKGVEKAYRKNVGKINIQGFRKGKAPRKIIERYYGAEIFYEDAVNIVLPDAYDNAVKENNIFPVDQPEIDIKGEIEKGKDITFTAKVTVKPEFELGEYKGVKAQKVTSRVLKKDIEAELEKKREMNSRMVPVEDRPIEKDDVANIDFEGFCDGVPFDGGKGEGFDLTIGSGQFIPGFEEQLIGKNIGDEVDVNVTFPEEYHAEELKGKPALFKVKINSIKVKELPELDDEFAKDVSEFDTLEDLKKDIKENLSKAGKENAAHKTEENVINAVCDATEIDIPDAMINSQIDKMLRDFDMNMRYQGLNLEQYLKYTGMTVDKMRAQFKDDAAKNVKTSLVLEKICEAEGIDASEDEINKEYESMAESNGMKIEDIKKYVSEDDVKETIKARNTIKFLVDNANFK